jgi:microcystin-dependent protein
MANYEATKYDFDGANLTGIQGVNTGLIVPWSDTSVPSGFLACDGTAVSRTTYANLFAVVGTTYGSGNGSTTFNVPDLQDNVAVGKSPTKAVASTGGANTVTSSGNLASLTIGNHTLTTPELPSHTHPGTYVASTAQPDSGANQTLNTQAAHAPNGPALFSNAGGGGAHTHPTGNLAISGGATSVLQPYLTVKYIIKT